MWTAHLRVLYRFKEMRLEEWDVNLQKRWLSAGEDCSVLQSRVWLLMVFTWLRVFLTNTRAAPRLSERLASSEPGAPLQSAQGGRYKEKYGAALAPLGASLGWQQAPPGGASRPSQMSLGRAVLEESGLQTLALGCPHTRAGLFPRAKSRAHRGPA